MQPKTTVQIKLNSAQKQAVDHIYGPLLVLAGPGTGKTQLLSARIANILQKTDVSAQNILCLTFTESAAQNMRKRLTSLILDDAYDVHINTYHGFGSDIIRSYPEYFEDINLETGEDSRIERPIDELQALQTISEILNKLPYSSPLIGARHFPKNIVSTISDLKKALITPEALKNIAEDNLSQVNKLSPKIADILKNVTRFPSKAQDSINLFEPIADLLDVNEGLADIAHEELLEAMAEALDLDKSKPLTAWKNKWLTKDENNKFVFTDEAQHLRMIELSKVFNKYQKSLQSQKLYDFDDMILRTINALKTKDELRFNLQEKYQFILLDEFQDTNAAQFELVKQLANNPVHEGQPNVFAVGDDDQAIYAFQGARASNMLTFVETYKDVGVINLTENYRSHPDILQVAHNLANQIESRLHYQLEGIDKLLTASSKDLPANATIERHEFNAEANEYAWVGRTIDELIKDGVAPSQIAILAPQHKYLEKVVPFLARLKIPITYEKRENILQTQLLIAFKNMCQLIIACHTQDIIRMNELFPQVLSYDFFNIPVKDIWSINWTHKLHTKTWAEVALDNPIISTHVLAFLALGMKADTEPLEYILDFLTGNNAIKIDNDTTYTSPLKDYYFDQVQKNNNSLRYYELLTNLSTIREHLRARQAGEETLMNTQSFLDFIKAYELAEQPLINTHPIAQKDDSVQLMTTYKAKGLEFEYVFLITMHDDVWGKKARGNSNKLSLPANLNHIRYAGSSEDELRRLLFVAITRAKYGLYLSSHSMKDNGKATEPVKYLLEYNDGDIRKSSLLPLKSQTVQETKITTEATMQAVETLWYSRHIELDADLKSLLRERLTNYQMSPTHLNTFIDTEYGGPEVFLLQTLLRFPQAPGEDGEFGNAIHSTLDWYQHRIINNKSWNINEVLGHFDTELAKRYIAKSQIEDYRMRGHNALNSYMSANGAMFKIAAKSEVDFRKEGVLIGDALLTGKLDRLEIDNENKTIDIVDFKTGNPMTKWDSSMKSLKYHQQLYFYKFLIEGSHSYTGYKVKSARLEFVEPDTKGKAVSPLYVQFNDKDEKDIKNLIAEVWNRIKNLDF